MVYKEKPGFSLEFPGKYRSRNKSNTIIIVITITIILQSTTNEKNTGNGCYHILIADLCCTYKKISHGISFFFFFFTSNILFFTVCLWACSCLYVSCIFPCEELHSSQTLFSNKYEHKHITKVISHEILLKKTEQNKTIM